MRTILLLVAFALPLSCGGEGPGVQDISAETLLTRPPDGMLILDVRTTEEFGSGHVPNAVNIPHDQLAARLQELDAAPETPVVVYCERGGRAGMAASVLLEAGYVDIFHLDGDMSGWRADGRPTEMP